jgi:transposase-like protein
MIGMIEKWTSPRMAGAWEAWQNVCRRSFHMLELSENIERRIYSGEMKQEAVRLVMEMGPNCAQTGQKLRVPSKTLANWVRPQRRNNRLRQECDI